MDNYKEKIAECLLCCAILSFADTAATCTACIDLCLECLFTVCFCLECLDMLNKDTAVTELVTLCLKIKLSVKVVVDFCALSEVNENLPEDADTADPLELF